MERFSTRNINSLRTLNTRRWRAIVCLVICTSVSLASGCSKDWKKFGDDDVQTRLLEQHEKKDALSFFEQGGFYFDADPDEKTTVDQDVLVPLLKRLKEIAGTDQWIMLRHDDKNWAHALLIALPRDPKMVDRMAAAVKEADDNYSGFILQQWGYKWLSIIPIDKEQYEFLKKNDPDIDKQR